MVALADIRKTWSLGGKYNREEPKSNRAEPKSNRAEPDPLLAIIFHPLAIVLCGLTFPDFISALKILRSPLDFFKSTLVSLGFALVYLCASS